ncbi:MAG: cysteine desulfurase [Myxococcales bacterium]|nr:cysteine desulfurase [Myxococcales bacterium]
MIYLDHNATTPLDPRVLEAMLPYLREAWGNPSSPYRFGQQARAAVERARSRVAECLGCRADEVLFTGSGTEADNLALRGVLRARRARGRHVVTSAIEHPAVLRTCAALEADGCRIDYVPVGRDGVVDLATVEGMLGPDTVLLSVMHANNETGVLQPITELAALARSRGVLLHVDAVQTAGKLPGRLADLGADLVSLSAHKLHGPKGVGALYVRKGTPLDPLITGGEHERGLRAGTENVAGIVGLAEALALACAAAESEAIRQAELRDRLERDLLAAIPGARVNGAAAPRVPNTTNLAFPGVDGESVVVALDLRGICCSTGSACSTGDPEPSHVLLAMGLDPRDAQSSVRLSLGRETRDEDIATVLHALVEVVGQLRAVSSL